MAKRHNYWCPFGCGKTLINVSTYPPKYRCKKCGLTFKCKLEDIEKTIPEEV